MLSTIKSLMLAAAVLVPAALTTHTASAQTENFRFSNESSYRIDHVYMNYSGSDIWGKDRLYGYLHSDHDLDLTVNAGRYDIMVVDSDGDRCVITGIDVYEDKVWELTNSRLLSCELQSR